MKRIAATLLAGILAGAQQQTPPPAPAADGVTKISATFNMVIETVTVNDKDGKAIEGLRADLERALNSSDNFREAATRNDRMRTRLRAAEKERQLIVQECRGKAQDIFERAAVQRAISDGGGRFEFEGVEPGRYGVVALEPSGERPRSWSFECLIAGAEARVLDPSADRAGFEADWGLR